MDTITKRDLKQTKGEVIKITPCPSVTGSCCVPNYYVQNNKVNQFNFSKLNYNLTKTWPSYIQLEKMSLKNKKKFLKVIFKNGIFKEIERVISCFPNCNDCGHVILISICSAVDSLSAFAYGCNRVGCRYTNFIEKYFPNKYTDNGYKIYDVFRCDSVHGWNLHKSIISGRKNDPKHLTEEAGILRISLYDFFNDLKLSFDRYFKDLEKNKNLRSNLLNRYKELKKFN